MKSNTSLHPIRVLRDKLKLRAGLVAKAAGVSGASLSKVENGHRDRLNVDACRALVAAYPGELGLEELLAWSWARPKRARAAKRRAS